MARICSLLLLLLPLFLSLGLTAGAQVAPDPAPGANLGEVGEALQGQLAEAGADELHESLPDEAQALLDELELTGMDLGKLLALSPKDFVRVLWGLVTRAVRQPLATLGSIIGIVVLCALADTLRQGIGSSSLSSLFSGIAVLCVVSAIAGPVSECIFGAAEALRACGVFMLSFIPAFTSIVMAGGAPVTATTYNLLLFGACQVISSFASTVLVPFLGLYMGLCIAGGVGEDVGVLPLAKGIRSFVTWSLTLAMTAYVGLLSMQTLVSVGADNAMLKTGKFLVGSFVPIVGGAISDALSAARGAMHLLKTTMGAFGILAGAVTFLPILVRVLLWCMALKAAAFTAEVLSLKKVSGLLQACVDCLNTMLAMLFCFMLLIIISIVLLLSFSSGI